MNFKEVKKLLKMMNVDMNEEHALHLFTVLSRLDEPSGILYFSPIFLNMTCCWYCTLKLIKSVQLKKQHVKDPAFISSDG